MLGPYLENTRICPQNDAIAAPSSSSDTGTESHRATTPIARRTQRERGTEIASAAIHPD